MTWAFMAPLVGAILFEILRAYYFD
jgi:hypothetical protein